MKTDACSTNATSYREAAAELRKLAKTPDYEPFATAHILAANSLEEQARILEAGDTFHHDLTPDETLSQATVRTARDLKRLADRLNAAAMTCER